MLRSHAVRTIISIVAGGAAVVLAIILFVGLASGPLVTIGIIAAIIAWIAVSANTADALSRLAHKQEKEEAQDED